MGTPKILGGVRPSDDSKRQPPAQRSPGTKPCGSEVVQEQRQCEPDQGERKRLVEILTITRSSRTVTYNNDA